MAICGVVSRSCVLTYEPVRSARKASLRLASGAFLNRLRGASPLGRNETSARRPMLRAIQDFFETRIKRPASTLPEAPERALQLATAALLIEVSRADHRVTDGERRAVADAVTRTFSLTPEETAALIP